MNKTVDEPNRNYNPNRDCSHIRNSNHGSCGIRKGFSHSRLSSDAMLLGLGLKGFFWVIL